jgi:hypothetical protein
MTFDEKKRISETKAGRFCVRGNAATRELSSLCYRPLGVDGEYYYYYYYYYCLFE